MIAFNLFGVRIGKGEPRALSSAAHLMIGGRAQYGAEDGLFAELRSFIAGEADMRR